ncbi:retrovirus-related pol polyprotein from transposon RE2 [Citrus sinensis]|nr:retrovirus-related pol polyprotein from transposon RE2 [Citrus sinensis]
MSKGRENKLNDFYVARQSPPTSMPPSTPGLRISLSEPFQGFKRLQLTSRISGLPLEKSGKPFMLQRLTAQNPVCRLTISGKPRSIRIDSAQHPACRFFTSGPEFLDLASIITANRMSYDDAYALLLTHEARLELNQNTKDLFNANYGMMNANYSQFRGNNRRGGYSGYQGQFNASNRNQNGGRGMPFNTHSRGFPAGGYTEYPGYHGYHPPYMNSSVNHHSSDMNFALRAAYIANFEGPADEGWYLDSRATHHITNNMANMHIRDQFTRAYQLIIGNGQGLPITHVGDAFFLFKSSNSKHKHSSIALKDILLVPSITKNLLSISKLTTDNNLSVEFLGNVCFVKDSLRGQVYMDLSFEAKVRGIRGRVYVARHVTFDELAFPYATESVFHSHTKADPQTSNSLTPQQIYHISSLPVNNSTGNLNSMITRSKTGIFKPKIYTVVLTHKEPDTVQKALNDSKWLQAIKEEYDALIKNNTWTLVPRQADQHVVRNKWVYRIKYNIDGSVAKYKARLVAKGFQQVAGVNYFETFSPVVKSATIRVILSLAVMNQWRIRQVDVNNRFLNGELTEEVFMSQPDGFIDTQRYDFVCKLHKSLYGLKQAPKAWRIKASMIIVLIYVDDILITGPNTAELEDCMYLSQRKYIRDLLSKVEMAECKGIDTPMSTGSKLQKIVQGELGYYLEDPTHYRSIVGGMQYLILTRPEIAFAVKKLSQYVAAPTLQHLMACKRVLRYIKATQDYGLKFFREGSLTLTGFTDADWACDLDDRKSVDAYCIYLDNNLISWSSKKQSMITRSSAESEYRALASASAELTWLQILIF